jgi:hypothetical protein
MKNFTIKLGRLKIIRQKQGRTVLWGLVIRNKKYAKKSN